MQKIISKIFSRMYFWDLTSDFIDNFFMSNDLYIQLVRFQIELNRLIFVQYKNQIERFLV